MKPPNDLPRWLDTGSDASPRVVRGLQAWREEQPSEAQLQALAERLGPLFDVPSPSGGGGSGSHPPPSSATAPLPAPLLVAPTPKVAWATAALGSGKVLPLLLTGSLLAVGIVAVGKRHGTSLPPQATPAVASAVPSAAAAESVIEPPAASEIRDPAPVEAPPATESARSRPVPVRSVGTTPSPSSAPAVAFAPVDPAEKGPTEVQLLRQAQGSLGGDPAGALALCTEHQRRFPRGALGQERDVIAIDALGKLGRMAEARARAARFLAAYPNSAHRGRVEGLMAK